MGEGETPLLDTAQIGRRTRRGLAQLGRDRILIALLLLFIALIVARTSWNLPLLSDAEEALFDVRSASLARVADTDKRIALVVYTADTNRAAGQISPVDRTVLAKALEQIDKLGAKGIGIDILFDSPQNDDNLLQGVLKAMRTPVYLAYATNRTNPEAITFEQEQDLTKYIAAVRTPQVGPTSILLETDGQGVARQWPRSYPGLPPLLSVALTQHIPGDAHPQFSRYRGPIRFRVPASSDRPVFDKVPIDIFADPASAPLMQSVIKDRYVLIGGDFADFDQFFTPFSRSGNPVTGDTRMIGVEVHAHMLAQLLDGAVPRAIPSWALWLAALVAVAAGGASAAQRGRGALAGLLALAQLAAFIVLPFILQRAGVDTLHLPSAGWIGGWLLSFVAVSGALRAIGAKEREFAQGALGKYLPPSIAGEIMRNPERLALHGEKREIFCVFSDLEGFTKLSHAIAPEMVAFLLNRYLDALSAVVLEHGGTLDKFVGDAVVAFWGAPIAFADDGERAVRAAQGLYEAGEVFRRNVPEGVPPIGRTRVGVHFGEAIVGNFGGEGRIQYTALGDAMNTAARLESANKELGTRVLVSREAMEHAGTSSFRAMGRVTLRGRATPVEVFEPIAAESPVSAQIRALILAHSSGDDAAVQRLTAALSESCDTGATRDVALAGLLDRLQRTKQGESYVLG